MRIFVLSMILGFIASAAFAQCGDDCCEGCDSCGPQKACKLVSGTKKIKKTMWVVECEEFCVPMPRFDLFNRCKGGNCGEGACGEEYCEAGCESETDPCTEFLKRLIPPRCGKPRCRKKLVKKEITCEVPTYKCEVGYGCGDCATGDCGNGCGVIENNAPIVPAPQEPTVAPAPAHPLPPAPSAAMALPRPMSFYPR